MDVGYSSKIQMYDPALAHSLKYNIAEFSAFKETSFRKQLESNLTKNGKIVPWNEFKKRAEELNIDYNKKWLKTEYHQTVATANMADKWQDIQANKDLYPNLKYVTAGDARVRELHKEWDGLILPIDHSFWKKHYPPNDWGCRCDVEQTDEEPTIEIPSLNTKKAFNNNAAESGKIFNDNPYESGLEKEEVKETKQNLSSFLESEKIIVNTKNPKVKISLGADLQDLRRNYQIANICAKQLKIDFLIRPHLELNKFTNPEYMLFNKFLGDRKSIKSLNNMRGVIDSAKEQMMNVNINPGLIPHYIVWDLDLISNLDINELIRNLQRKVTAERGKSIKGMVFQYKGKAVHLSREEIVNREFENLKSLK